MWALIAGDGDVGVDGDEQINGDSKFIYLFIYLFCVSILGLVFWRRQCF